MLPCSVWLRRTLELCLTTLYGCRLSSLTGRLPTESKNKSITHSGSKARGLRDVAACIDASQKLLLPSEDVSVKLSIPERIFVLMEEPTSSLLGVIVSAWLRLNLTLATVAAVFSGKLLLLLGLIALSGLNCSGALLNVLIFLSCVTWLQEFQAQKRGALFRHVAQHTPQSHLERKKESEKKRRRTRNSTNADSAKRSYQLPPLRARVETPCHMRLRIDFDSEAARIPRLNDTSVTRICVPLTIRCMPYAGRSRWPTMPYSWAVFELIRNHILRLFLWQLLRRGLVISRSTTCMRCVQSSGRPAVSQLPLPFRCVS